MFLIPQQRRFADIFFIVQADSLVLKNFNVLHDISNFIVETSVELQYTPFYLLRVCTYVSYIAGDSNHKFQRSSQIRIQKF